ncbi:hypothetical protein [Bradyrhizobium sp.]|uniref:DUF6894 family protein n=1 Tax=Bradyrhizobium sp. TaxID=376 RepID=UPI003521ED6E
MAHLVVFHDPAFKHRSVSCRCFSFPSPRYAGCSDCGAEFADRDAAWKELTGVCGDMVGGISRKLKENGEWQMELLDPSKKPVFRIRLVAETLD